MAAAALDKLEVDIMASRPRYYTPRFREGLEGADIEGVGNMGGVAQPAGVRWCLHTAIIAWEFTSSIAICTSPWLRRVR